MIVDASAIVAIVFREPELESLIERLQKDSPAAIGAPSVVEAGIVCSARLGKDASPLLSRLLLELEMTVIPFGEEHARAALSAWRRFGKGRHPAALNFGDCMAYAVAAVAGEPLLCTGRDFQRTDLDLA